MGTQFPLRTKIAFGAPVAQAVLLLAHWFLWHTANRLIGPAPWPVKLALLILAFSFFPVTAITFRLHSPLVRFAYKIAALWLGVFNYLFWAAVLAWPIRFCLWLLHRTAYDRLAALLLLAVALCTVLYGLRNAQSIRIRRLAIQLPNLPPAWHQKKIALVSDTHFGAVNGPGFSRRVVNLLKGQNPDLILIAGDLFDGAGIDPAQALAPWKDLQPRHGICFATGNHEEFGDRTPYLKAVHDAGIRILDPDDIYYLRREGDSAYITSALVELDGLQIAGLGFHDTTHLPRLRSALAALALNTAKPSILIHHVPNQLPEIERAGFSLMVSGHTHGGQFFPFNLLVKSIFGPFASGHARFGKLQTLTSLGAGTWGPPIRVGTRSEILLIELGVPAGCLP